MFLITIIGFTNVFQILLKEVQNFQGTKRIIQILYFVGIEFLAIIIIVIVGDCVVIEGIYGFENCFIGFIFIIEGICLRRSLFHRFFSFCLCFFSIGPIFSGRLGFVAVRCIGRMRLCRKRNRWVFGSLGLCQSWSGMTFIAAFGLTFL